MITIIRWILLKQKEIKLKLAFYRHLEQGIKYLSEHKEEFEKLIAPEGTKSADRNSTSADSGKNNES